MFAWQNNEVGSLELPGLTLSAKEVSYEVAKFDLSIDLAEVEGRIVGSLEYAAALFTPETIQRHVGYLQRVLAWIATTPGVTRTRCIVT